MARDTLSKRERNNKKNEQKKRNKQSDSDSDQSSDGEMDVNEFRKYLQKIFPSKHLENKIKSEEKLKQYSKKDKERQSKNKQSEQDYDIWGTDSDEYEEKSKGKDIKDKRRNKEKKGKGKDREGDDISLGSEDTYEDTDYDEEEDDYEDQEEDDNEEESEENDDESEQEKNEDEEDDDEQVRTSKKGKGKLNIILSIGNDEDEDDEEWEDYDSDEDEDEEDSETENEDEEVSTDESSSDEESEEDEETPKKKSNKSNNKSNNKLNKSRNNKKELEDEQKELENEKKELQKDNEVLTKLKEIQELYPSDKSIYKCIESYEEQLQLENKKREKKQKKQKDKNMRIFKKILTDKNALNDFTFYKKLEIEDQKKMIKELREINKIARIEKPYRMTLLECDIPIQFKAAAFKKISMLRLMEPRSGEYYKLKQWVDTFMKIPFTNYCSLPITIDNGVNSCHEFMENAQKTLDNAVYGLNDAKMQIMQMLGQFITNPKAVGTAIAIHGPPGTGKTSLVKEGISKILNRPFAFIALGGATDSSFLEGHSYTYEGSSWGKIVQILIDSKCMNPVIYFDELDKISDTPRGEEIVGILTHLTDTTQNSEFHDKFFTEINFDLSKCLFIFSYNDESKVNPILKDRMYRIKTKGYSNKEKTVISNNYLLPKIRDQVRFNQEEIIIPDDVIGYINDTHCNKEDGVRNLKRCLEIIHTKLNLYRLMKPGSNLFEGEMALKVEFPFKVTKDIVDKLIKKEEQNMSALYSMYV